MSAPELTQPEQKGCGDWQELQRLPILDHPKPDIEIPTDLVHPIPEIEKPTDTAHAPDPALDELNKPRTGCGGKLIPGLQEIRDQLFNFVTWIGSDGKTREVGDLGGLDIEYREDNKHHIFDDRKGHIIDTPENRHRIKKLVGGYTKFLGPSKWGNWWYGEILPDGTQLWAEVRGEKIVNCGINKVPEKYNPTTGLSALEAPGNNNTK